MNESAVRRRHKWMPIAIVCVAALCAAILVSSGHWRELPLDSAMSTYMPFIAEWSEEEISLYHGRRKCGLREDGALFRFEANDKMLKRIDETMTRIKRLRSREIDEQTTGRMAVADYEILSIHFPNMEFPFDENALRKNPWWNPMEITSKNVYWKSRREAGFSMLDTFLIVDVTNGLVFGFSFRGD